MIQRIQSVYLFVTALLSFFLFNGILLSFFDESGSGFYLNFLGISRDSGAQGFDIIENLFLLSAIIILIPTISMITMLLFKYRKVQLWFVLSLIFLISGLIVISFYYSFVVKLEYNALIIPGYKMIIPGLQLVFAILAYRGIKKDDLLVKSYDRLR
jgi:Domain of unknown function (DUF4293)